MKAPATTSQVSLASQTGPIVLISTRRSVSSRPSTGSSVPTPKSNPSSTKYPANMYAMSRNQTSASDMIGPPRQYAKASGRDSSSGVRPSPGASSAGGPALM